MSNLKDIYPFNLARDLLRDDEEALKIYLPGIEAALDTLPERYAGILRKRYRDKMTLRAIGEVHGIGQERVRQIEARSLAMLQRPDRLNMIKAVALSVALGQNARQEAEYQKLSLEYALLSKAFETGAEKPVMPDTVTPLLKMVDIMQTPIEKLGLSTRSYCCLARAGKKTVRDVADMSREELAGIRNLGAKSLHEITECLKQHGIEIRDHPQALPLREIVLNDSWGDTYAAQKPDAVRAAVLCAQACRRDNSLQHVADLLQRAMDTSGSGQNVEAYLMHQRLPRSLEGLHEACKRFAQSLGFTF